MQKVHKWWGLIALMPALAMTFADQSILPVALPSIQEALGASNVALQWSVNSYLLVTAVLVLVGGKLGDLFGHRRTFSSGMFLFVLSSILCAISPNLTFLIGARALQGVGAALMYPASTALLSDLFPPSERGRATGILVSASSLFLILGPLLGGYLTQNFTWRWIFWINVPVGMVGLWLIYLFIPKSKPTAQKIDFWGFVFFTVASTALVSALMEGREWGWVSGKMALALVIAIVGGALLVWREKRAVHPFLDLKLFRHPVYKAINISVGSTQFIMMITVFWPLFFQKAMGLTPLQSGAITFFSSIPTLFMAPVGGWLADKFSPRLPIAIGFLLLMFSFFWLGFYDDHSLNWMLPGFFAFGAGIPFVLTPSYTAAMGAVPPTKRGIAFGTLSTVRSLGGSVGLAVIGSLYAQYEILSFQKLMNVNEETRGLDAALFVSQSPASKEALAAFPNHISLSIVEALKSSQVMGFSLVNWTLGFAIIVSFMAVFVFYRAKASHHLPETPSEGWD
ncbi:MAG: MFS transporter [Verrucomicrobia bacterium]|nr:MFS transporter [Verrucomicrobiota bacterium]